MKMRTMKKNRCEAGFSLLELMIVLLVLSVMMGAVFSQIRNVQVRSSAEQTKLDLFQESREFMDQLERDLHEAGYPNSRNFGSGQVVNGINEPANAVGLVKIDVNELWFEGDVDGDGVVDSVQYQYDGTSTGCPCLKRSSVQKVAASPLSQGSSFQTEVQHVQNGTSIFRAYKADGSQVTLPVDLISAPTTIASIKTIRIELNVQSNHFDLQTRQYPQVTLSNTVSLNNCSQAPTCVGSGTSMVCGPGGGLPLSCN
jgi:prepilin-type N-terminal cleavage/methylation domain-containing protein